MLLNHQSILIFSAWNALLEPIALPLHILATLPDIRMGVVAILAWFFAILLIYTWVHTDNWKLRLNFCGRGILYLVLYLMFALLIPLPNWALEKTNSHHITTDLHSHSLLSHDGIVTLEDNLSIHHERGYDLVALTNHPNSYQTTIEYQAAQANIPEAILGLEIPVYYGGHFYLSALGFDSTTPLPNGLIWYQGNKQPLPPKSLPSYLWSVKKLMQVIHEHGGAIAVVALHLDAKEVRDLTQAGVDAFEIVNFGHHPLPEDVRQAMLEAQKEHGVALIASNDWHGWTGILNTWTLIHPNPDLYDQSLKIQVIDALRHHGKDIVPLTAYSMHPMSHVEIVFAPFIAIYQYAKTISTPQILALWAYFFLFLLLSKYWRCKSISLMQATQHLLIIGMSSAILWHGLELYQAWNISLIHPPLAYKMSLYAIGLGVFTLLLESYHIKHIMQQKNIEL